METDPVREQIRLEDAIKRCPLYGFEHVRGWLFRHNGRIYDLSAAWIDKNNLALIARDGLFVVAESTSQPDDDRLDEAIRCLEYAVETLDPEMARRDIVCLREHILRTLHVLNG